MEGVLWPERTIYETIGVDLQYIYLLSLLESIFNGNSLSQNRLMPDETS